MEALANLKFMNVLAFFIWSELAGGQRALGAAWLARGVRSRV
jgi:hypothetical protein